MGMGGPPKPNLPTIPPPAAHPAILGASTSDAVLKAQKARADSSKYTAGGTVGTSPEGDKSTPSTARSTLLGQ